MKTILFLALLPFSIHAIAQQGPVKNLPKEMNANSIHLKNRQHEPMQYPATFMNAIQGGQNSNHSSRDLFGLTPVYDSIHQFTWGTMTDEWQLDFQYTDLLYNGDNYLTSLTAQDRIGSTWVNNYQINYTYDGNNNETERLFITWEFAAWANDYQILSTYDGNNLKTNEVQQIWGGSSWMNNFQSLYTYDNKHNLTSETDQTWDGTGWLNTDKSTYTYDFQNNLTKDLTQEWEDVNAVWINISQHLYTYDGNNNQLTNKFQVWNGLSFDDNFLTTYTYNGSNQLIKQLSQLWDGTQWRNATQTTISYTGDDQTYVFWQEWNGFNWENDAKQNNTFNGNHQWTKSLYEVWDGNTWLKATQSLRSYGEDDFISGASSIYFDEDGLIILGDSTHNFFKTVSGIKDMANEDASLTIYPNPSSGKFTLSSEIGFGNVTIYNSIGERVYFSDKANDQTQSFNLVGYPKGLYLAKIKAGDYTTVRKIIIQ